MTWFLHSVESISLADGVQLLTFIFALILFWVDVRRRRIEDAKGLRTQRIEIYQRLEIESNAVFKFEAENKDILPEFKTRLEQLAAQSPTAQERGPIAFSDLLKRDSERVSSLVKSANLLGAN